MYTGTLSQAKRQADLLRRDGLIGTQGEVRLLARYLAEFGVDATVANHTAGTQDELPARPIPEPPRRLGTVTAGAAAVPPLVLDAIPEPERAALAGYLRDAACLVAGGYWTDPVTRDPLRRHPEALMSDGVFLWSIAWATLVELYGCALPEEFLTHVRAADYRPPELSASGLQDAAASAGLLPGAG